MDDKNFTTPKDTNTTKSTNPKTYNDQTGENASEEFRADNYDNAANTKNKGKPTR